MTHRLALILALLVAVPASAQDREVLITLDGRELSPVVEVWRIQAPAVPAAEADADEEPAAVGFAARHPILTGAIFGAVGGCIYGAAIGSTTSDFKASDLCMANALVWSGIVAGTVAFARWYRDAAP